MFSKLVLVLAMFLGLSVQAYAHAIISPALGVQGAPVRNDVQRPTKQSPCGKVNIAQTIGTTQPIIAQAQGTFVATVQNFNAGVDGSRQVTAQVDATGTGSKFVSATVITNGDKAPTNVGSQNVSVSLPAGTKCSGGPNANSCLVSFVTAGGFGNCVVVQQGATSANGTAPAAPSASPAAKGKGKKQKNTRAYGSRAARAVRRAMEEIEEWL